MWVSGQHRAGSLQQTSNGFQDHMTDFDKENEAPGSSNEMTIPALPSRLKSLFSSEMNRVTRVPLKNATTREVQTYALKQIIAEVKKHVDGIDQTLFNLYWMIFRGSQDKAMAICYPHQSTPYGNRTLDEIAGTDWFAKYVDSISTGKGYVHEKKEKRVVTRVPNYYGQFPTKHTSYKTEKTTNKVIRERPSFPLVLGEIYFAGSGLEKAYQDCEGTSTHFNRGDLKAKPFRLIRAGWDDIYSVHSQVDELSNGARACNKTVEDYDAIVNRLEDTVRKDEQRAEFQGPGVAAFFEGLTRVALFAFNELEVLKSYKQRMWSVDKNYQNPDLVVAVSCTVAKVLLLNGLRMEGHTKFKWSKGKLAELVKED